MPHPSQGRATVEMGLTFKSARDNGIKGGTMRIVSPAHASLCPSCRCRSLKGDAGCRSPLLTLESPLWCKQT